MKFKAEILAADHQVFKGEVEYLKIPTIDGLYGVMANHSNTMVTVNTGTLTYREEGKEKVELAVSDGFAKIEEGEALVIVQTAETKDEIDLERAKRAEKVARKQLERTNTMRDYHNAYAKRARALEREKLKG